MASILMLNKSNILKSPSAAVSLENGTALIDFHCLRILRSKLIIVVQNLEGLDLAGINCSF